MNKKKKFIILLLILIIILIILGIALRKLTNEKQKEEDKQQSIIAKEEFMEKATKNYFSDRICPQGMATLYSKYNGDNDLNELYKGLYDLVHYIDEMYSTVQNFDNTQLKEYYQKEPRKIRMTTGMATFEEFTEFVNYLKTVGYTADDEFKYCKIDTESYKENNIYLMFNINFYYEGKDNLITLKTYFSKKSYINYDKPKLKFSLIKQ